MTSADIDDQNIPEDAMRRLAEMKPGQSTTLFTSDLSVNEFLLVREAGFRPLGLVLGSSIYHVGFQIGRWSKNQELGTLSNAMYHARELAMTRMEAEADVLGADGIVGVRLEIEFKEFGNDLAEFIAVGTAVKAEDGRATGATNTGKPFTSDLYGQDFWTLMQAGYAPLGMVMGSCVYHIAHQRFWQAMGNIGQNVEIPQFTEALYDARELAMSRMQAEAEALHAEGIVGVQLLSLPHRWGGHTTEFFAIGTAVRPLRADHTIAKPQLVLPVGGLVTEGGRDSGPAWDMHLMVAALRGRPVGRGVLHPGADRHPRRRAARGHGRGRVPRSRWPTGSRAGRARPVAVRVHGRDRELELRQGKRGGGRRDPQGRAGRGDQPQAGRHRRVAGRCLAEELTERGRAQTPRPATRWPGCSVPERDLRRRTDDLDQLSDVSAINRKSPMCRLLGLT